MKKALLDFQRHPDNEASFYVGWQYYTNTNDWRAADKWARETLKQHPDWASAHLASGQVAFKQLDEDLACEEYKKAVKLKPCWPKAWMSLADLYVKMRQYSDALAAAENGLKILVGPESWISREQAYFLTYKGRAYLGLGDSKNAIAAFEKYETLEMPWEDTVERFNLSSAYVQGKQWNKAIAYISKYMSRDPNQFGYLRLLAEAHAGAGHTKEALHVTDIYTERMNKANAANRASQCLDERKIHELRMELFTKLGKHDLAHKEEKLFSQGQREIYDDSFFMEKEKPARRH